MSNLKNESQIIAIAGLAGAGKTSWILQQIQIAAQTSAQQIVYFAPSSGTVAIDANLVAIQFPDVEILSDGQELDLFTRVANGAIAYVELGFHLNLAKMPLLDSIPESLSYHKVAVCPRGRHYAEFQSWADRVVESDLDTAQISSQVQVWRSPLTGQVFDPSSLNVFWYELTEGGYGEVYRCKGIFDLADGRAFYIDYTKGKESVYIELRLPRWLEGRPQRFSGIEVVGAGLDNSEMIKSITDCCLSDEIIQNYQQQIKRSQLISV